MSKTPRFHVIMENAWGKLDERFADSLDAAKSKLQDLIAAAELRDGDCFRIVDRQPDD